MEKGIRERTAAFMQVHQMVRSGDRVAVGLSGGADSVCLLHLLWQLQEELGIKVRAVHVNHGLRPEAEAEEQWVRALCEQLGIPLQCFRVDVKKRMREEGLSTEEAARLERYAAFERAEADKIALAHHRRDQAETVLLHLLRGSGLRGLGGIRPVRGRYIRPLLEEDPEELRRYNREQGLDWQEDASNESLAYQRNRIRHELLPYLREHFNPGVEKLLSGMARQLQEDEAQLAAEAAGALERLRTEDGLQASETARLSPALASRVVRLYLQELGCEQNVEAEHTEQVLDLCRGPEGRRTNLPGDLTLIKSYDILKPYKDEICETFPERVLKVPGWTALPDQPWGVAAEWAPLPEAIRWTEKDPREEWAQPEKGAPPMLRTRRPGDFLMASGGRKRLQDYLVDAKIPASERDRQWLLTQDSHVLWVVGRRLSDGARVPAGTDRALHLWLCTKEEFEKYASNNQMKLSKTEDGYDVG